WDPAWSPDGSRIAFASSSGKAPGIYAIGADAREERRLTRGYALYPTWSSEGSRIAYGRIRGRPGSTGRPDRISIVNLDGSGETTFSPDGGAPAWSPDGSRIAFTAPPTQ